MGYLPRVKVETVEDFLARGGEITTTSNMKEHFIKKQRKLGRPSIVANDYSNKEFEEKLHRFYNSKTWKLIKEQVYKTYVHMCPVCGSEDNLRIDHIKPVRHYPSLIANMNNLQILCNDCNLEKGSMIDWTLWWHIENKESLSSLRLEIHSSKSRKKTIK